MANYRQIHTRMWSSDRWFVELKPGAKLLFIYLFSNERVSISGLYEIPLRVISFETGLDKDAVTQWLEMFQKDGKIAYDFETGVLWVKNMMKYQSQDNPNEKIVTRIKADVASVPDCSLKQLWKQEHRVSMGYGEGIDGTVSVSVSLSGSVSSGDRGLGEGAVFRSYSEHIGELTARVRDDLGAHIDEYSAPWVLAAIERAVERGIKTPAYIAGILRGYQRDGGTNPTAARGARKPKNKIVASADALTEYARKEGFI